MELILEIVKGKGSFEVEWKSKQVDKVYTMFEKLIKRGKKEEGLSRNESIIAIIVVLSTVGNGYIDENYLTEIDTQHMGLQGFQSKLEFEDPRSFKNLIYDLF